MKNAHKQPKQRSLLGYFESSSPSRPEASSSKKPRLSLSPKIAKRKRSAPTKRRAVESDPPSDDGGSTSSDVGGIAFEPQVVEISSDEEDAEVSPKQPTATQRKTRKRRAESAERTPVIVSSDSGEERIGVPITWKGKAKAKAQDPKGKRKRAVLDSDSDEDPQPRKSKLVKGARPPTPETDDEDLLQEVEEERESPSKPNLDLAHSNPTGILESRLRTRDKKSQYQKSLEKLKREL